MFLSIPELLVATQFISLFTSLCNTTQEQGIVAVTIIFTIYVLKLGIMYSGGENGRK